MELANPLHHLGTMLGCVGALVSAFLMIRLGDDGEHQRQRGKLVRRLCLVTWAGLLVLLGSGVALTFQEPTSSGLLLHIKHALVVVIVIDAVLIHFRFFPRYFDAIGTDQFHQIYITMRAIGALSVSCWLAVIVLSIVM